MTIEFWLLLLGAYLLGSVPSAHLVARWTRGIDLRQYGSGNVGAANIMTVVSKWWGGVVVVYDVVKGFVPVYIAQVVGLGLVPQIAIGLAAISGHNWPIFLGFNGGRGFLTIVGVGLVLAPKLILIALAFSLFLGLLHQLAVGSIVALVALPVCTYFFPGAFGIVSEPITLSLGFVAVFIVTVIRRLTGRRAAIAASVPTGQLMVNRLFFDRDIRDRNAWIHRTPEVKARKSPEQKT